MIILKNKDITVHISEIGAEMHRITAKDKEILWCRDPKVWSQSAPILFPICGRLREERYTLNGKEYHLPIHGFAHNTRFSVAEQSDTHVRLFITDTEETLQNYPFHFEFSVSYTLTDHTVEVEFATQNKGNSTLYYSLGGHYGFALADEITNYELAFDRLLSLDRQILDGAFFLRQTECVLKQRSVLPLSYKICDNDTYAFLNISERACVLRRKGAPSGIRVEYPDSPHLMLWTLPGQKYICVEPWNGSADFVDGSTEISKKQDIISLGMNQTHTVRHKIIIGE